MSTTTSKTPWALAVAAALSASAAATAGDLLTYTFDSLDGTPALQAAGITGSVFDRDPGHFIAYTTLSGNPAPAAASAGWDTPDFSDASYYTFSLTSTSATAWNSVRLDLKAAPSDNGNDAATHFSIRYSVDSFASSLMSGSLGGSFASEVLSQHVDAGAGQTVEYRIYAWGASDPGATVAVDNVGVSTEVTPVPETPGAGLVGVALAAAAVARRAFRRSKLS